jgi:hypothetical protein
MQSTSMLGRQVIGGNKEVVRGERVQRIGLHAIQVMSELHEHVGPGLKRLGEVLVGHVGPPTGAAAGAVAVVEAACWATLGLLGDRGGADEIAAQQLRATL